jgi:hypothetical protein
MLRAYLRQNQAIEDKQMLKLNTSVLSKALYDLKEVQGISFRAITKSSGVHNLGKIMSEEIAATPDSWWRLHKAYPDTVPEPEYTDGSKLYKNINNFSAIAKKSHQAAGDMNVTNNGANQVLPAKLQVLVDFLLEKDKNDHYLNKFLLEIMQADVENN